MEQGILAIFFLSPVSALSFDNSTKAARA